MKYRSDGTWLSRRPCGQWKEHRLEIFERAAFILHSRNTCNTCRSRHCGVVGTTIEQMDKRRSTRGRANRRCLRRCRDPIQLPTVCTSYSVTLNRCLQSCYGRAHMHPVCSPHFRATKPTVRRTNKSRTTRVEFPHRCQTAKYATTRGETPFQAKTCSSAAC